MLRQLTWFAAMLPAAVLVAVAAYGFMFFWVCRTAGGLLGEQFPDLMRGAERRFEAKTEPEAEADLFED